MQMQPFPMDNNGIPLAWTVLNHPLLSDPVIDQQRYRELASTEWHTEFQCQESTATHPVPVPLSFSIGICKL